MFLEIHRGAEDFSRHSLEEGKIFLDTPEEELCFIEIIRRAEIFVNILRGADDISGDVREEGRIFLEIPGEEGECF